jgi:hypothetical protein
METIRGAYRVFMTNPEGKRPLGRRKSSWEDNIKIITTLNIYLSWSWVTFWPVPISHKII